MPGSSNVLYVTLRLLDALSGLVETTVNFS